MRVEIHEKQIYMKRDREGKRWETGNWGKMKEKEKFKKSHKCEKWREFENRECVIVIGRLKKNSLKLKYVNKKNRYNDIIPGNRDAIYDWATN